MKYEFQNPQINIGFNEFKLEFNKKDIIKSDEDIEYLFSLLNGRNSLENIIGTLIIKGIDLEVINTVLNWLNEKGFLIESDYSDLGKLSELEKEHFKKQINFFGSYRPDENSLLSISKNGLKFQILLKKARVIIVGEGNENVQLINFLIQIGIGHIYTNNKKFELVRDENFSSKIIYFEDLEKSIKNNNHELLIYCSEIFNEEKCLFLNQICLSEKLMFLPYRRSYLNIEIGPLSIVNSSACYYCSDSRKKSVVMFNEPFEKNIAEKSINNNLNFPIGIEFLSLEIIKIITNICESSLKNKLLVFDIYTGSSTFFPVFRLPRCVHCGVNKLNTNKRLWEY